MKVTVTNTKTKEEVYFIEIHPDTQSKITERDHGFKKSLEEWWHTRTPGLRGLIETTHPGIDLQYTKISMHADYLNRQAGEEIYIVTDEDVPETKTTSKRDYTDSHCIVDAGDLTLTRNGKEI